MLLMDRTFPSLQELPDRATLLLNSRPRSSRLSPIEELYVSHLEKIPSYEFIPPTSTIDRQLPYRILTKNPKDGSLSPQEIIAHSRASLYWTVSNREELHQTKTGNSQPLT